MTMHKHSENCECELCFREAVLISIEKSIKKAAKENPGVVCPFCGTNPSKKAKYGSGFKDWCGHEVRKNGLVIGWRKNEKSVLYKCTNSEKTRKLVFIRGKWR